MRIGHVNFFSHDNRAEAVATVGEPPGSAEVNQDQRASSAVESVADGKVAAVNLRSA